MLHPPDWFCILKYAIDKRLFDYGLSFSYLVGATRSPIEEIGSPFQSEDEARSASAELYERMKLPCRGWIANFDNCMNPKKVGGLVVTLVREDAFYEHPGFEVVWQEYGQAITEGRFSKNGHFHPFRDDEIAWIKEARSAAWQDQLTATLC
jgi:hypothetical protein